MKHLLNKTKVLNYFMQFRYGTFCWAIVLFSLISLNGYAYGGKSDSSSDAKDVSNKNLLQSLDFLYQTYEVNGLTITYHHTLLHDSLTFLFEWGDGCITNNTDREHTYPAMGYYNTCISVVEKKSGLVINKVCQYIEVADPELCEMEWNPVCGCDNQTYTNRCFAENLAGVFYWTEGPCTGIDFSLLSEFGYNEEFNTLRFLNTSVGNYDSFYWDFGDGKTSKARNPKHTYMHTGTYDVCLTVSSEITKMVDTYCEQVNIEEYAPTELGQKE